MFSISLNRVRDKITVKEGNESLILNVDSDSRVIVTKIRQANELLVKANASEAKEIDREIAARRFSEAIFGQEQTDKLMAFYNDDYSCVIMVCSMYFEKRLCKKITSAQKRQK